MLIKITTAMIGLVGVPLALAFMLRFGERYPRRLTTAIHLGIFAVWLITAVPAIYLVWDDAQREEGRQARSRELAEENQALLEVMRSALGTNDELVEELNELIMAQTADADRIRELERQVELLDKGYVTTWQPDGTLELRDRHDRVETREGEEAEEFAELKRKLDQDDWLGLHALAAHLGKEYPRWPTPPFFQGIAARNLWLEQAVPGRLEEAERLLAEVVERTGGEGDYAQARSNLRLARADLFDRESKDLARDGRWLALLNASRRMNVIEPDLPLPYYSCAVAATKLFELVRLSAYRDEAIEHYEYFIENFPQHPNIEDAQYNLDLLRGGAMF